MEDFPLDSLVYQQESEGEGESTSEDHEGRDDNDEEAADQGMDGEESRMQEKEAGAGAVVNVVTTVI